MLKKTWRWFGDKDPITLDQLVQMGVEGVVTALHHIPNGEIWSVEEISKVKSTIEKYPLHWSVVESLPVAEGIKMHAKDHGRLINNYQQSLRNLGKCGIDTVCYNFMPVLDWVRTDITYTLPNGGESMYFDRTTFAAFDIHILKRPGAENDYPDDLINRANEKFRSMTTEQAEQLAYNIIVYTQGFIDGIVDGSARDYKKVFLEYLQQYKDIGQADLQANLKAFLDDVVPVAEEAGVRLCMHPDDPPFPVLGLPRIISQYDDLEWLLQAYPSPANGITFCTGSLSARKDNDLLAMIKKFGDRIHFIHLRNTQLMEDGSFYESGQLTGSQDMAAIVKALLQEQDNRIKQGRTDTRMPMRPDHGIKILDDLNRQYNPGYPLTGRLKGLAELDGLMQGLRYEMMG